MFTTRAMSAANLDANYIRSIYTGGHGFVTHRDGVYRYAVMLSSIFKLMVVRRTSEITFSDTVAALSANYKVVINGNYFSCGSGCYTLAAMGDVHRPNEIDSIGAVRSGGSEVLPDASGGSNYFYFGRENATSASSYVYGFGNPPATVHEGMGGLGPIILTNPATQSRVRYGVGNRYTAGHTGGPAQGDPGTHWSACTQRNNNTYVSLNSETESGMGAVGINTTLGFLIAVIKPHGQTGNLDTLRDKLWDIGVTGACFIDGSNSVCMALNRTMVISPYDFKNNLIEVGIGFYQYRTLGGN